MNTTYYAMGESQEQGTESRKKYSEPWSTEPGSRGNPSDSPAIAGVDIADNREPRAGAAALPGPGGFTPYTDCLACGSAIPHNNVRLTYPAENRRQYYQYCPYCGMAVEMEMGWDGRRYQRLSTREGRDGRIVACVVKGLGAGVVTPEMCIA